MTDTVLDRLTAALDAALRHDSNVSEPPTVLFWPDQSRQWESVISEVQQRRPVLRFGDYDPSQLRGPSYWLRCVIAGTVTLEGAPAGTPVVYLPGVSRSDLRTLENTPAALAPLAALQHRGQWFSHPNGKDWTVRALFAEKERGLGFNVASDEATAKALVASLPHLVDQPAVRLGAKYIDAAFLNHLINPDPVQSLLAWLDDPSGTRDSFESSAWAAFVAQCRDDLGFNPDKDGEIVGARRLGEAEGEWVKVWQRFRVAPADYPGVVDRLRLAEPAELVPKQPGAWPTRAADAEDRLRTALLALADEAQGTARQKVLELEVEHKERRSYVWADLGLTPLALALEHLAEIARLTLTGPVGSSVAEIVDWYTSAGWQVDRSVLAALNEVDPKADVNAVEAALTAIYRPWLDANAKALQTAVGPEANAGTYAASPAPQPTDGEIVVFIDGLRLDVAHLIEDRLNAAGATVALSAGLAALPTVTQTSKPALVPVDQTVFAPGELLEARRGADGPPVTIAVLRGLMDEVGVQVLGRHDVGDPSGVAWTETGEVDHLGHDLGVRLAHEIEDQVHRIATRIEELLNGGWKRITVVTDHGWLLLPGGLPKNEQLPVALTETKKGRCARLKAGATTDLPTVPWHWDRDVRMVVAPGISCFEANQAYEHGGVSPQECVVPRLSVQRSVSAAATGATVTSKKWRGLTLAVEFTDLPDGARVDLRADAGNAESSIATVARTTGGTGKTLLMVEDDDLEGDVAFLVVVAADDSLLGQWPTTVGQNR